MSNFQVQGNSTKIITENGSNKRYPNLLIELITITLLVPFDGGGGVINDEICFDVSSQVIIELGVGGGTVIVAKNESKSNFISLSFVKLFDKIVSIFKQIKRNIVIVNHTCLLTPRIGKYRSIQDGDTFVIVSASLFL